MQGVLSWLVRWACRAGTNYFYSALAALVDQVQIFFPSPYTISIPVPNSQNAGQAVVLGRLSLSMFLCVHS